MLNHFLNGNSSSEEEKALLQWLDSKDGKEHLDSYYQEKWAETSNNDLSEEVQDRMYHRIKFQIEKETKSKKVSWFRMYSVSIMKYAAVALIFLCLGILFHSGYFLWVDESTVSEYIVSADKGQKASITLPDGTKVWLNSHTRLKYATNYGKKIRNVKLEGQAYFEVAKDKAHPFIVQAGEVEIESLGTAFDVKAYKEDGKVTTSLYEGKVLTSVGDNKIILNPNEQACYDKRKRELKKNISDNPLYARLWRNNELSFDNETMEEIAIRLNRLYNISVKLEDEKLKKYCFSGVIKNNSMENFFEILSLTIPIQYVIQGDTIILSLK